MCRTLSPEAEHLLVSAESLADTEITYYLVNPGATLGTNIVDRTSRDKNQVHLDASSAALGCTSLIQRGKLSIDSLPESFSSVTQDFSNRH